jgi:hypothetical protein
MEGNIGMVKEVIILAVTKMHGGVCIAGIDKQGEWVRPIRPTKKRIGECDTISDYCLLPIDFFHRGKSHFINGAMTRIYLTTHSPTPPHIEDWIIDTRNKPQLLHKLNNQEQTEIFSKYCESDISKLVPNEERSLGLFLPESFSFHFAMSKSSTDISVRADFKLGDQKLSGIGCTDLRMRALGRKLLEKSDGASQTLTQSSFKKRGKLITYLSLGLSRLYRDKHWLIVVGVHSIPEIAIEVDYSRL